MCFSATASFVTSGGLAVVGAATLKAAPRRRRILALVPFVFAVQQALEGIQWLYLKAGTVCPAAGYGYLFFALLFWPVFIPLLVFMLDRAARPRVKWFLGLGIVVALWNLAALLSGPLAISGASGNIVYSVGIPTALARTVLYVIVVCGALFALRITALRWFGALITAAALVAFIGFRSAFASVWCYFAAVISALVFWYARRK